MGALLILALVLPLGSCRGASERNPGEALSLRTQRICRERMAELPARSTQRQSRLAYGRCLRSPSTALPSVAGAAQGSGESAAPEASTPPPPLPASAEERYLFCRLNSEAINAAITTYHQARFALLNSGAAPGSPERSQAEEALQEATEALEEAIPPRMRAGQALLPDAVQQFSSCERSRFP
ncbi:MAG: hypothetical protein ACKOZT_07595 [Cyanobium sp.]